MLGAVNLPQVIAVRPFEPSSRIRSIRWSLRRDQPAAEQDLLHRRHRRARPPIGDQRRPDLLRPPSPMAFAVQRHDLVLHLAAGLQRTRLRPPRPRHQPSQPIDVETAQPLIQLGLRHPKRRRRPPHRHPPRPNLQHSSMTLLHNAQHPQRHGPSGPHPHSGVRHLPGTACPECPRFLHGPYLATWLPGDLAWHYSRCCPKGPPWPVRK